MTGCHIEPIEKAISEEALSESLTAILVVSGLGCNGCAQRVRNGLLQLEGVIVADVVLEQNIAGVAYDPKKLSPADLVRAVADSGDGGHHVYEAELIRSVPSTEVWSF